MKCLLCTLFVYAPGFLALRAPKHEEGFPHMSDVSSTAAVDEAIRSAPQFVEDAMAFEQFMNGSHRIVDALQKATVAPESITSFLDLEGRVESAMEKSHAWTEMKNIIGFASKKFNHAKLQHLGINSMNVGLARSGAPWYSLMKSLSMDDSNFDYFDQNDVKLVGAVSFFLNIGYKNSNKNVDVAGRWRICMAASLAASIFFRGKFYNDGFTGSDFGGEDFYFAFANSDNVPGWSWSMDFNHDYVRRYLGASEIDKYKAAQKNDAYANVNHQFSHLSRLTGGFEFTSSGPLKELVAINFGYCIMGRSQGGACVDVLEGDKLEKKYTQDLANRIEADRVRRLKESYPGLADRIDTLGLPRDDLNKNAQEWNELVDTAVAGTKVSKESVRKIFRSLSETEADNMATKLTSFVEQERKQAADDRFAEAARDLVAGVQTEIDGNADEVNTGKMLKRVMETGVEPGDVLTISAEEVDSMVDKLKEARAAKDKKFKDLADPLKAELSETDVEDLQNAVADIYADPGSKGKAAEAVAKIKNKHVLKDSAVLLVTDTLTAVEKDVEKAVEALVGAALEKPAEIITLDKIKEAVGEENVKRMEEEEKAKTELTDALNRIVTEAREKIPTTKSSDFMVYLDADLKRQAVQILRGALINPKCFFDQAEFDAVKALVAAKAEVAADITSEEFDDAVGPAAVAKMQGVEAEAKEAMIDGLKKMVTDFKQKPAKKHTDLKVSTFMERMIKAALAEKKAVKALLGDWKEDEADALSEALVKLEQGDDLSKDVEASMTNSRKFGLTVAADKEEKFETLMRTAVEMANKKVEGYAAPEQPTSQATLDRIMSAEKWSKNTVETGVGHCWCTPDWKATWHFAPFSDTST